MREFSEFEKKIIKEMVSAKEIKELSLASLIDENSPAIAIEWSIEPANFTIVYRSSVGMHNEIYFKVQEIIFLLQNLEDEKLINMHHHRDLIQDNRLYNHKLYGRKESGDYYFKIGDSDTGEGEISDLEKHNFNTYFGRIVQHFVSGIYFVSNALRNLEKNDFKSPEQLRFERQLKDASDKHLESMVKAQSQITYSRLAFYFSITAFISSLVFGIIQMNCGTKIEKDQFIQIKQSIEQSRLSDVIKAEITNDTLITKIVEMPKAYLKQKEK